MFGWLRKSVIQAQDARQEVAIEAASLTQSFMIQIPAAIGPMTKEMISDPFIVGAIASHAAITSKVISNGQCPQSVTENAMVTAVILSLSGTGVNKTDAIGALYQFKNHPEYTRASQAITLILGAKYGRKDLVFDPVVVAARKYIQSLPKALQTTFGDTEAEQVAYKLTQELLVEVIKIKHPPAWQK
jgi:hypothetical protein